MLFRRLISNIIKCRIVGNSKIELRSKLTKESRIRILGNNNYIKVGNGCILENTHFLIIGNNSHIIIDNQVVFRKGILRIEGNNVEIHIKNNTTIRDAEFIAQEDNTSIIIGEDCMFSYNIKVRTSDAHSIINNSGERINHPKNVVIGNHVWISENVTILKGSNIGDNSIIGYGSICTDTIPPSSIAAGIPARIKKNEVNWDRKLI